MIDFSHNMSQTDMIYFAQFFDFPTIQWDIPSILSSTVCPKVPYISKVSLFSAVCGWIPKPFDLLIALTVRFDLVYEVA